MPAYKVVTNYDNMFSDNPAYPSHSYVAVPNGLKSHQRPLPSGTRENITSSSGLQVTGKDRALFFKRPVLQMSQVMPLPHIRYTREMTMSVEDVARHDERKRLRQRQFEQLQHKRKSTPEMSTVRAKYALVHRDTFYLINQYVKNSNVSFLVYSSFNEKKPTL